jgi:hypothetical protein
VVPVGIQNHYVGSLFSQYFFDAIEGLSKFESAYFGRHQPKVVSVRNFVDRDQDGQLSFQEAFTYARTKVEHHPGLNYKPRPTILGAFSNNAAIGGPVLPPIKLRSMDRAKPNRTERLN